MLSNTYFKTIGRLGKTDTSVRISKDNRWNDITQTNVSVVAISDDKATIEQMKVSMTGGVMTILSRGLNNSETVVSDPLLKKDRGYGTEIYITALAPDIVSPSQTNSFSQKQTFTDIDVSGTAKIDGKLQVDGKYQWPVVADITARNLLYPAPVSGNEVWVTSLNSKQVYNGGTAQWESLGVSTPVPDATKLVKGIVKLATDQEAIDGTIDTVAVTPKQMSKIDHLTESIFMVGETVAKNDSLFPENMVTSAGATEVIEFGKTTADKRVVMYGVGNWVASNKIKLWLKKFWSPSVDVSVRIETVDWSWLATGTLVDANAYGTTLTSGLTTTVVDTEIALNGSITIPKGTNVAVIVYAGTYGSETVNGTNYFGLAYKTQVTRSFWYGLYNTSYTNYTNKMVYFSSDLLAKTLLSKTSASQKETLPIFKLRFANNIWVRGDTINVTYLWMHKWFIGKLDSLHYISNTYWAIDNMPWTINYPVWYIEKWSLNIKEETYTDYWETYTAFSKSVSIVVDYLTSYPNVVYCTMVIKKSWRYTFTMDKWSVSNSWPRIYGLYCDGVELVNFSVSSWTNHHTVNFIAPYNNCAVILKEKTYGNIGYTITNFSLKYTLYNNDIIINSLLWDIT